MRLPGHVDCSLDLTGVGVVFFFGLVKFLGVPRRSSRLQHHRVGHVVRQTQRFDRLTVLAQRVVRQTGVLQRLDDLGDLLLARAGLGVVFTFAQIQALPPRCF